jgi:hypothetical protein
MDRGGHRKSSQPVPARPAGTLSMCVSAVVR